jgi:cold-inducible RNA-binding protein
MKLYVGNLSFSTTEADLRDLFAPYGTVTEVVVVTDRMSGKSRGFAFVTMGNRHEGQAAIAALEGLSREGRNLTVSEARPKSENRPKRFFSSSKTIGLLPADFLGCSKSKGRKGSHSNAHGQEAATNSAPSRRFLPSDLVLVAS